MKIDLRNREVPDDHWLKAGVNNFPKFKDVYYVYDKYANKWILYDNYWWGRILEFNASKYRIDQCFEFWFKLETVYKNQK